MCGRDRGSKAEEGNYLSIPDETVCAQTFSLVALLLIVLDPTLVGAASEALAGT